MTDIIETIIFNPKLPPIEDNESSEDLNDIEFTFLDAELSLPNKPIEIFELSINRLISNNELNDFLFVLFADYYIIGVLNEQENSYQMNLYFIQDGDTIEDEINDKTIGFVYPLDGCDGKINKLNLVFRNKYDVTISVWMLEDLQYKDSQIIRSITFQKENIKF